MYSNEKAIYIRPSRFLAVLAFNTLVTSSILCFWLLISCRPPGRYRVSYLAKAIGTQPSQLPNPSCLRGYTLHYVFRLVQALPDPHPVLERCSKRSRKSILSFHYYRGLDIESYLVWFLVAHRHISCFHARFLFLPLPQLSDHAMFTTGPPAKSYSSVSYTAFHFPPRAI